MWFLFTICTILMWSGSDLFSKMGTQPSDKLSHFKMLMAVGFVMGAHAIWQITVGGVDYECEVQVNGMFVGSHLGGYCAFEFDVTRVWDRSGENIITVKVVDRADKSYQTFGKQGYGGIYGIWQTVWLESRPNCYIDHFVIQTRIDGSV
ncbi:MAG: hypothetical protein IJ339_02590, partial [Oscillospiraceae bacterium]|nr:hypothetical protein [Oscillospiraceae bacterium]